MTSQFECTVFDLQPWRALLRGPESLMLSSPTPRYAAADSDEEVHHHIALMPSYSAARLPALAALSMLKVHAAQVWEKHQKMKHTLLNIFKDLLQEVQARWEDIVKSPLSCNTSLSIHSAAI